MKVKLQVVDDENNIVLEQVGPVENPIQWKSPPGHPLIVKRPGKSNGIFKIWSITVQPMVTLELNTNVLNAGETNGTPVQFGK